MSSRLCIKGLPKHCDERRLREHFESNGYDVTDVKVVRTKAGKSRQFGFIGLKTEEAAESARQHFARTFIDTSRIFIEDAKPVGDAALDRPWSKHSKGSSAYTRTHKEAEAKSKCAHR